MRMMNDKDAAKTVCPIMSPRTPSPTLGNTAGPVEHQTCVGSHCQMWEEGGMHNQPRHGMGYCGLKSRTPRG